MPFTIPDERATQLAIETTTPSQQPETSPLAERLEALQAEVQRLGTPNPNFDEKAFLDEMWAPTDA
jgi:antitoxin VapB